ncbi:MAG: cytochrome c peroxidase [Bacteroidota bacterium]
MKKWIVTAAVVAGFFSCQKPDPVEETPKTYPQATAYEIRRPLFFPEMDIPAENPLTVEGIALGKKLFYDPILSGNNTLSCGGCHNPDNAFTDPRRFSKGIDGVDGPRNSMPLFNLGYQAMYFWDGRAETLEKQILEPVPNPVEMHQSWKKSMEKLSASAEYRGLFGKAFGSERIDSVVVTKAIAQFLRTLVSSDSKFDKYRRGEATLTAEEFAGLNLFMREGGDPDVVTGGQNGADCFHCHGFGDMQFTDYLIHNNGLDSVFRDPGAGGITRRPQDMGKFKTPSLRNVGLTAPYMHDGRFGTLEEVIEHYNSGGHKSSTIDPFMKYTTGGLNLSPQAKKQLIAFLRTLDDPTFVSNPAYRP